MLPGSAPDGRAGGTSEARAAQNWRRSTPPEEGKEAQTVKEAHNFRNQSAAARHERVARRSGAGAGVWLLTPCSGELAGGAAACCLALWCGRGRALSVKVDESSWILSSRAYFSMTADRGRRSPAVEYVVAAGTATSCLLRRRTGRGKEELAAAFRWKHCLRRRVNQTPLPPAGPRTVADVDDCALHKLKRELRRVGQNAAALPGPDEQIGVVAAEDDVEGHRVR